jgi:heterotetrameric sarcosine oxidase gamma subunit
MADPVLLPRSPLDGLLRPGRHGVAAGAPGAVLREEAGWRIASVAARRGQATALAAAAREAWGVELPAAPRQLGGARIGFLWAGPEQWLALAPDAPAPLEQELRQRLGGLASVAEQGDGRVVLHLSGPRARDLLAKLVAVDLHPRAFRAGDTAITLAAHMGVQLWQVDEAPSYRLLAFRGFAGSLYAAIVAAGEEYGIEVLARG